MLQRANLCRSGRKAGPLTELLKPPLLTSSCPPCSQATPQLTPYSLLGHFKSNPISAGSTALEVRQV